MEIPGVSEPYPQTVGRVAGTLREMSGDEPRAPPDIVRAIVGLTGREDAPTEILTGEDACAYARNAYARKAAEAVAASDRTWHDLTASAPS